MPPDQIDPDAAGDAAGGQPEAEEGAKSPPAGTPAGGLASRIDALMATAEDDDDAELLDEAEAVEELGDGDVSIEAAAPPLGGGAPRTPRPVVVVPPPRPPTARLPSMPGVPPPPPRTPSGRLPAMPGVPPPRLPTVQIAVPPMPSTSRPVVRVPPLAPITRSSDDSRVVPAARPAPIRPQLDHFAEDSSVPLETGELDRITGVRDPVALGKTSSLDGIPDVHTDEPSQAVIAPDVALETQLETPTVVEKLLVGLGEAVHEQRAADLAADAEKAGAGGGAHAGPGIDRAAVAGLHYELGELYERRLADEARAVKAFGKALSTDPSLRPNLWAIRRIFYRRGLWPNLQKLLDAELRFARTDHEKADLFFEKGLLLRDRLDHPVEARAALEEAIRLDPDQMAATVALERMVLADGDLPRAAELWEQLARNSRSPERKLVHLLELVRYHADTGDLDRAAELITEAVALGVDPERVAEERLRIAELGGDPAEVLAALEAQAAIEMTHFHPREERSAGGPAGLPADALHVRTPGTPLDRATAMRLRVAAIRRRQAQVARAARSPEMGERAWDYLQRAIAVAPGEPLLLADLADLAEELGRFDELAELVQSWQSLEGDPSRAVTLSIRRADALLRGGQRDAARALLASLEATAPGFLPLTALAERDALTSQEWTLLAAAWGRAAEAARLGTLLGPGAEPDPALAASLYVAAAEIWVHDVEPVDGGPDPDVEARSALGHALEVARGYPPAIEALVELHERAGRVDEAAAVLELQAESPASSDLDARIDVLARLARLYRDHGQHEQALAAELRLRRLLPDDIRLLWQVDVTLAQLSSPDKPERLAERIANLQAIAARDTDPARKGIALSTAARLAEDSGDRDKAIDLFRQVLQVWPGERYARAAMVELLRAQERWEDLVAQRRAEAKQLSDGPGLVRALREAAWVLEERLGRPGDAAQVYRELLDRAPDEPSAALGLVRCRAASGDAFGLVAALEGRLESQITGGAEPAAIAGAAVTLATAHEAAGRVDDAVDAYRKALSVLEDGGVSAPSAAAIAALALSDVAAARGDHLARGEAYQALSAATASGTIAAALHEDIGWLQALVLEDFDRAAESFREAGVVDPSARGPMLGALLVAGRRGDTRALATATAALAEAATMPEAAVALHLRTAALVDSLSLAGRSGGALGEDADGLPTPTASLGRARATAPDDVGALVVAAERAAAPVPPPRTASPEEVAHAVDALLARAEIFALRAQLADDPAARASWELDRAEALEAAGRLKEAGNVVAGVLRNVPGDFRALEALRRLARRGGDATTFARATVTLARRMTDPQGRAELLREAAAVFDPNLGGSDRPGVDAEAAVGVYKRILADDPGAADYDRLAALYRGAGDLRGLHLAIDDRIGFIDRAGGDPKSAVPLLLERARLRKGLGNLRGAAADLDELLAREPAHAEGLRQSAELTGQMGNAPRAVELWRRFLDAGVDKSPQARAAAELALSKLLAEDMGDTAGAIVELERVISGQPDDVALRERLIGLATRAQDWPRVARELREMARLRQSNGDKAREELRLAEIQRDKLSDRAGARATLGRARGHDPFNLEIIEPLIALTDDPAQRTRLLGEIADELRGAIEHAPSRSTFFERLFAVAGWQGDRETSYWAALAVEALGAANAEHRQLLTEARSALGPVPRAVLDAARRQALRPAAAGGVLADAWRAIAPAVTAAAGIDAAKLGFARGDKIAVKNLGKAGAGTEPLAAVLAVFGLAEVEVYVSPQRAGIARVLSGETPAILVGADVASGAAPQARYWLGRSAMLAAEATGSLFDLKEPEVGWFLAAAVKAVELAMPPGLAAIAGPDATAVAERTKLLQKHLSRRDKKALAAIAPQLGAIATAEDVAAWRRGAISSAHRAGLLIAADLAPALAALDVRGARAIADSPHAADLIAWSVSLAHLELRRHLGLGGKP